MVSLQPFLCRNFEQKTLSQMKTVYPTAYTFRQEKGIPSFANKVHGYQLTVEPNLEGLGKEGKLTFCGKDPWEWLLGSSYLLQNCA